MVRKSIRVSYCTKAGILNQLFGGVENSGDGFGGLYHVDCEILGSFTGGASRTMLAIHRVIYYNSFAEMWPRDRGIVWSSGTCHTSQVRPLNNSCSFSFTQLGPVEQAPPSAKQLSSKHSIRASVPCAKGSPTPHGSSKGLKKITVLSGKIYPFGLLSLGEVESFVYCSSVESQHQQRWISQHSKHSL